MRFIVYLNSILSGERKKLFKIFNSVLKYLIANADDLDVTVQTRVNAGMRIYIMIEKIRQGNIMNVVKKK